MEVVHNGVYLHKETGSLYVARVALNDFSPFINGMYWSFTFDGGPTIDKKHYSQGHRGFEKFVRKLFFVGEL